MMNELQRNSYLEAMQIDRWLPRVSLPYAAPSSFIIKEVAIEHTIIAEPTTLNEPIQIVATPVVEPQQTPPVKPSLASAIKEEIPHFSLQLMQAGACLILVELATGEPLQLRDPPYQLLRNILKAAKLPDSPQLLGEVIHWPLFKQATIPQGAKEAQEFLQSYVSTYQEQVAANKCLWLVGAAAIHYTTGLTPEHFYQTPIIAPIGQTLLAPSLELLLEQPEHKAPLWQSIQQLIPLWQV